MDQIAFGRLLFLRLDPKSDADRLPARLSRIHRFSVEVDLDGKLSRRFGRIFDVPQTPEFGRCRYRKLASDVLMMQPSEERSAVI